jgi:hypothetical protein
MAPPGWMVQVVAARAGAVPRVATRTAAPPVARMRAYRLLVAICLSALRADPGSPQALPAWSRRRNRSSSARPRPAGERYLLRHWASEQLVQAVGTHTGGTDDVKAVLLKGAHYAGTGDDRQPLGAHTESRTLRIMISCSSLFVSRDVAKANASCTWDAQRASAPRRRLEPRWPEFRDAGRVRRARCGEERREHPLRAARRERHEVADPGKLKEGRVGQRPRGYPGPARRRDRVEAAREQQRRDRARRRLPLLRGRLRNLPGERDDTRGKALDRIGRARTTGDPQPSGPRVIPSAWWRGAG